MLWRARRAARSLGWSAIAAIALAAFGIGVYFSSVAPLRSEVELQRDAVEQARSAGGGPIAAETSDRPELQLADFYQQLGSADQASDVLRRLYRNARNTGLSLDRGEYRPVRDSSAKILRYQIGLPVKGAYPQVRRFLAQTLSEQPGLALDSIGFQRETSGTVELDVQLRMTLFVRAQG